MVHNWGHGVLAQALTLPLVAPSLGGVETLITMPAATSHLALGAEARKVTTHCAMHACMPAGYRSSFPDPVSMLRVGGWRSQQEIVSCKAICVACCRRPASLSPSSG